VYISEEVTKEELVEKQNKGSQKIQKKYDDGETTFYYDANDGE